METRHPRRRRRPRVGASIGPRIFLRGNGVLPDLPITAIPRFNWATDFSPWKRGRDRAHGRACRRFNWATDFSPWKLLPTSGTIQIGNELQLGHGFFSVETGKGGWVTVEQPPLQLGHGFFSVETPGFIHQLDTPAVLQLGHGFFSVETNARTLGKTPALSRFNWATDFSPWKPFPLSEKKLVPPRFNWATDFSPWKPTSVVEDTRFRLLLQLGHGFFSVETVGRAVEADRFMAASIGPRIFLRGNSLMTLFTCVPSQRLQLGHGFFSVETIISHPTILENRTASIGPRIFLRGNRGNRAHRVRRRNGFNWATDFSPWKRSFLVTRKNSGVVSFNWATDFSPWKLTYPAEVHGCQLALQLGHGFFSVETREGAGRCPVISSLQLGHGFFSVETGVRADTLRRLLALQLGHGFFSVETRSAVQKLHSRASGFNWATDFSPWKPFVQDPGLLVSAASIGPRIFLRGNAPFVDASALFAAALQLGHGFFSVETHSAR